MRKIWLLVSVVLILGLAACVGQQMQPSEPAQERPAAEEEASAPAEAESEAAPAGDNQLVILQPSPKRYAAPYIEEFRGWYQEKTGQDIAVERIRMGGPKAVQRVQAAGGRPQADVLMSVGFGTINELKPDFLMQYKSPNLEAYPETIAGQETFDPDGYYTGFSFSAVGILINNEVMEANDLPKPTSYADLADPSIYNGWLVMGNPAATSIAHRNVQAVLQAYGWEEGWRELIDIAISVDKFTDSTGKATSLTTKGEYLAVLTKDAYYNEFSQQGDPIDFVYPQEGTYPSIVYAGILKGARHTDAAKMWMDWISSKEGQEAWARLRFETPVRKDASAAPGLPSLEELLDRIKPIEGFDLQEISNRYDTVTKIFAERVIGYQGTLKGDFLDGDVESIDARYQQWIVEPRQNAEGTISEAESLIQEAEGKELTSEGQDALARAKENLEQARHHYEVTYDAEKANALADEAVDEAELALAHTQQ